MTVPRLGTRGSLLALTQSRWVAAALEKRGGPKVEIEVIRTVGDERLDQPLHEISGQGLFTRELDEAVLSARVQLAVHSLKDLPLCCVRVCALPPHRAGSIPGMFSWGQRGTRPPWLR